MNSYLRYLVVSNSIFVFADSLFIPLYALFVTNIGGNAELAGILFGLKFIATIIVEFLIIRLKDRSNLDIHLLKLNFLLRAGAWLSLAFFQSIPWLVAAQIIIGASEGVGSPAFQALISDNLDAKKHLKEWSQWGIISNTFVAAASIASGFIITIFGFRMLFLTMAILAFIALALSANHKGVKPEGVNQP